MGRRKYYRVAGNKCYHICIFSCVLHTSDLPCFCWWVEVAYNVGASWTILIREENGPKERSSHSDVHVPKHLESISDPFEGCFHIFVSQAIDQRIQHGDDHSVEDRYNLVFL